MSSGCNFSDRSAYPENGKEDSSPPDGFEASLPSLEYAGPFESSHLEGTDNIEDGKRNNDGDDMIDDSQSVGSFPSDDNTNIEDVAAWTQRIFGTQEEPNTTDDIQFGEGPSKGLNNLMCSLNDTDNTFDGGGKMASKSNGNEQGKAQTASTKKRKGTKQKDKKASNAAKKREINKWKKYFDHWLSTQPKGMPSDTDFMELARKMIDDDEHLDEHTKLRQLHVLDNGFQINTFDEMKIWWTTVKSFGKVPRGDYEKNDCPVCKCGPERKLVDLSDHNCPYCHDCFTDSGWKKLCVLKEDCKKDHALTEV